MEDILSSLTTYGYIVLFLYSFGGGMLAIIAAGVLSFAGKMDLTTSIIVASCANIIGSSFLFYMGRYNKKGMMVYIKAHRRKLALSHILMKKYGDKIIFIQKFIYGLKTLVPLTIGITKYPQMKFYILNSISSIIWALLLGVGSYMMGEVLIRIATFFSNNSFLAPLILASIIALLWLYFHKATQKRS